MNYCDIIDSITDHCCLINDYLNLLQVNKKFYQVIIEKKIFSEWKQLHENLRPSGITIDIACRYGCVNVAKYLARVDNINLIEEGPYLFEVACGWDHINITMWLREVVPQLQIDMKFLTIPSIKMGEWLRETKIIGQSYNYLLSCSTENHSVMEWAYELDNDISGDRFYFAIMMGNIELCEWFYQKNNKNKNIFDDIYIDHCRTLNIKSENNGLEKILRLCEDLSIIKWIFDKINSDNLKMNMIIHHSNSPNLIDNDFFNYICCNKKTKIVKFFYELCNGITYPRINIHIKYLTNAINAANCDNVKWLYENGNFELDEIIDQIRICVMCNVEMIKYVYFVIFRDFGDLFVIDIKIIIDHSIYLVENYCLDHSTINEYIAPHCENILDINRHKNILHDFIELIEWIGDYYPHELSLIDFSSIKDIIFIKVCLTYDIVMIDKIIDIFEKFNLGIINIHVNGDILIKFNLDRYIDDYLIDLSNDKRYGKFVFNFNDEKMMIHWSNDPSKMKRMYKLCQTERYDPIPEDILRNTNMSYRVKLSN